MHTLGALSLYFTMGSTAEGEFSPLLVAYELLFQSSGHLIDHEWPS